MIGLLVKIGETWIDPLDVVAVETLESYNAIDVVTAKAGHLLISGIDANEAVRIINRARESHMGGAK